MYKLQPREKNHPPLSQQPPLKIEILSTLPLLFENLVGGSTPNPPAEKSGVHTMVEELLKSLYIHFKVALFSLKFKGILEALTNLFMDKKGRFCGKTIRIHTHLSLGNT